METQKYRHMISVVVPVYNAMYEKKDRRICVVQERKKGVSAARNSGLKMARGEYILFVDADDFLPDSNVLERFVTTIQLTKADIVVGNYVRLWNGQQLKAVSHEAFSKEIRINFILKKFHMQKINFLI